ncbi:prophage tail fiber N-terminal domain-containing protein [Salmonella enterica]|uniref:prophage tail fiber N-terminal domain-containing protein n=1 Tax=Salmonella enterica TaxID=28901 RepID=UPI003D6633E9
MQLKACRTSTTVIVNTVASENPDDAGRYSMEVETGAVHCHAPGGRISPSHAGVITVYDDSKPGTLNDFLGAMTEDDVRRRRCGVLRRWWKKLPPGIGGIAECHRRRQASEQAQTSAGQAAESATAAVNAAGAAEASATQAASSAASAESSAGTATTKSGRHQPARRRLTQPERRQPHRQPQRNI